MLHYEITGNAGEDLVLLHGFMENNSIWSEMEPTLLKKFRLIKMDLPGHGQSSVLGEKHSMELMADEVYKTLSQLGVEKFHLLGHSMGGYVSLAYAEKFENQLQSLTLFFSTPLADSEEKKETRKKSIKVIEENFNSFVNASIPNLFDGDQLSQLKTKVELAKEIAKSTPIDGVTSAIRGMMERPNRIKVIETFPRKILVIAGEKDNAVNTSDLLKNLPNQENLKVHVLPCGHNGHWELPEVCAHIIVQEL